MVMWAAGMLPTCAWHMPPRLSIVGSTYILLMHVIIQGKFLVNKKSTSTSQEYSLHMANFLSPLKIGLVTGIIGAVLPCLLFWMFIVYVIQDIAHKSTVLSAKGQFGQRVRQIVIGLALSDE
jgi:hypothetical protein